MATKTFKIEKAASTTLIKGVTDLIVQTLNKDPHLTHVVIQEIDLDDWGYAGEQTSELRKKGITADKKA